MAAERDAAEMLQSKLDRLEAEAIGNSREAARLVELQSSHQAALRLERLRADTVRTTLARELMLDDEQTAMRLRGEV